MGLGTDAEQPFFCGEVSVFHHGLTHFFATHGIGADTERARWVADAPCLGNNKTCDVIILIVRVC